MAEIERRSDAEKPAVFVCPIPKSLRALCERRVGLGAALSTPFEGACGSRCPASIAHRRLCAAIRRRSG